MIDSAIGEVNRKHVNLLKKSIEERVCVVRFHPLLGLVALAENEDVREKSRYVDDEPYIFLLEELICRYVVHATQCDRGTLEHGLARLCQWREQVILPGYVDARLATDDLAFGRAFRATEKPVVVSQSIGKEGDLCILVDRNEERNGGKGLLFGKTPGPLEHFLPFPTLLELDES